MKLNKLAKQATVVSLGAAILFGGSGSLATAKQKKS